MYLPLESWKKEEEMQLSIKQICKTTNNNYFATHLTKNNFNIIIYQGTKFSH